MLLYHLLLSQKSKRKLLRRGLTFGIRCNILNALVVTYLVFTEMDVAQMGILLTQTMVPFEAYMTDVFVNLFLSNF
ncbi:hypothetical protein [Candidatus Protochlamydia sp. W-9]|uniref:hypothetical protein n=1 Tax=Candidatus Protochlamydia sp. W-9 TaxID=1785087 RepID=UPI001178ADD0|nr:hypothetical protein [Candidatus Protochlamydia sp. W-9]